MNPNSALFLFFICAMLFIGYTKAGLITYGICQSGCNALWVACVTGAGGVAGVTTGGTVVIPAVAACCKAQGVCMSACAVVALANPV
jgi:hypothetical protein